MLGSINWFCVFFQLEYEDAMQVLPGGLFADDDVDCVCDSSLIIATAVKPV